MSSLDDSSPDVVQVRMYRAITKPMGATWNLYSEVNSATIKAHVAKYNVKQPNVGRDIVEVWVDFCGELAKLVGFVDTVPQVRKELKQDRLDSSHATVNNYRRRRSNR